MPNPVDQDRIKQLIIDLAAPIFTWRMYNGLVRNGRELAMKNAAEKIDAIVTRYVHEKESDASGLLRELLHIADNGFMAPEVRAEELARIRRMAEKIEME